MDDAVKLHMSNGDTYWMDAIEKEINNITCAFRFNDSDKINIGHKKRFI